MCTGCHCEGVVAFWRNSKLLLSCFLQLYAKFFGVKLPLFARERILCRKSGSLSRAKVFFRGDDVRVEKMGRGIEKTEAANDDSHVCSLRSWSPLRSASRDVEARLVYFIFHIACPHHSLVFQDFCENRFERSDPPNFIAAVFVDLQEAIV